MQLVNGRWRAPLFQIQVRQGGLGGIAVGGAAKGARKVLYFLGSHSTNSEIERRHSAEGNSSALAMVD